MLRLLTATRYSPPTPFTRFPVTFTITPSASASIPSLTTYTSCHFLSSSPSPNTLPQARARGFVTAAQAINFSLNKDAQELDELSGKPKKKPTRIVGADKVVKFRPVTPSLRHTILIDRSELWRGRPEKSLCVGLRKTGGRNRGRIACRFRGGGHKRLYRDIDFKRQRFDTPAVVQRLEYDPNRTCHIALIAYPDGELSYVLAPQGIAAGDAIQSSKTAELEIKPGNCMPLRNLPVGTVCHNVELYPGRGGQLGRAAGTQCKLLDKNSRPNYALVELASKEQRFVHLNCMATVGQLTNPLHKIRKLGKAGRKRWLGRRPHNRGVSMNPVDHPMGGGQGKTAGGRPSCSPTGVLSKGGFKTRDKRKTRKWISVPRGGIQKGQSVVKIK